MNTAHLLRALRTLLLPSLVLALALGLPVGAQGDDPLTRARSFLESIEHGVGGTQADRNDQLFVASASGAEEEVVVLIAGGADPRAVDLSGRTPLHLAVAGGHSRLACHLTAGLAAADQRGNTPLHLAALLGDEDGCQSLLELGAAVSARRPDGVTPLHLAASRGDLACVGRLLAAGASPLARDLAGRTAADLARDARVLGLLEAALEEPTSDPIAVAVEAVVSAFFGHLRARELDAARGLLAAGAEKLLAGAPPSVLAEAPLGLRIGLGQAVAEWRLELEVQEGLSGRLDASLTLTREEAGWRILDVVCSPASAGGEEEAR